MRPKVLRRGSGVEHSLETTPFGLPIVQALPPYADLSRAGAIFSASTAAAGVDPDTGIDTTAPFALENPIDSPVDLVLIRGTCGYKSGTPTALTFFLCGDVPAQGAAAATPIVSSTGIVEVPARVHSRAQSIGIAHTTATLLITPEPLLPLWSFLPITGAQVIAVPTYDYDFGGLVIVPPGGVVSYQAVAVGAGTSPLLYFGATWAEVRRR